jgi:transcriptional regulator with XRE-family HTH domain
MDAIAAAETRGTADGVALHFRDPDLLQGSPTSLAARLQYARIQAGYTQSGLAVLVGISRARIAKIESDNERSLPPSVIAALAAALSVTEAWLHHGGDAEMESADEVHGPAGHRPVAQSEDIELRTGLALLRVLRRQYVMGRLTHRQLRAVCTLARELASKTPKEQWAIEHPMRDAGARIQARRVFLGLSKQALAASAALSEEVVSEIEHGTCIDPVALAAAAHALGMTAHQAGRAPADSQLTPAAAVPLAGQ